MLVALLEMDCNQKIKYNLLTTAVHNFYYIMSNVVHVPPTDKDDDTNEVVAIGKDTFPIGDLDEQSGAVLIGRGVLKNTPSGGGKGSVVIVINNMVNSTSTTCEFNTIIGRNACEYLSNNNCSNNVVIGNQACREPGDTKNSLSNCVVIGCNRF